MQPCWPVVLAVSSAAKLPGNAFGVRIEHSHLPVRSIKMTQRIPHNMAARSERARIAVVIPTRDRGDAALATVRSLMANDRQDVEIVVVDQSAQTPGQDILDALPPNVRWLKSPTQGVARARNEGVAHTLAPLIGFVDDDCEVAPDWLERLEEALGADPRIKVAFGNTLAAAHDGAKGFIPAYVCHDAVTARSIAEKNRVEGISACMGTTREAFRALHGFDALLGAGGRLRSGAETDYTIRALLAGFHVLSTPALEVTHHGFRDWAQARVLLGRYWYGTGATFAKHLRLGNWRVMGVLAGLTMRWLRGGRSTLLASSKVPYSRVAQVAAFARGFFAGLRHGADRRTGHFRVGGTVDVS
jgi:GT2 family glycosyltransferase